MPEPSLNILFSVPRLHTNYSGMMEGLIQSGHKLSFITMEGENTTVPFGFDVDVYGFTAKERFFTRKLNAKLTHYESFSKLNKVLDQAKPDIIITRDLKVLNIQLSLLARIKKIPVLLYDQILPFKPSNFKRKVWNMVAKHTISRYRITTVTNNESDAPVSPNTVFIPFAISETDLKQSYRSAFSASEPLRIIVVSKLGSERKNLPFLLKSLLPLFQKGILRISIYGIVKNSTNSIETYRKLQDFIGKHNLSSMVNLYPNEPFENVLKAYSGHDLFILPSLNEPAAISPFEAMSSGIPVIVTSQNGTNYIIDEGKNGFIFNPEDEQDLLQKVTFFLNNPEALQHFGQHALETINQNYRPCHFSKNLNHLIVQLTK